MKLLELKIQGYKNLKKSEKAYFDLRACTNYTALVGLNGSGKSNILEAISLIFSSIYHNSKPSFSYWISYLIGGEIVNITDGEMTVGADASVVNRKDHQKYLPNNVIASYSGEDLRMWDTIYLDSYADFFQDIKKQSAFIPKLLYINKFSWEFALIALLSSEEPGIQRFISDVLHIGEDVTVKFTIDENNYGLYEDNEALSLIKRLVELPDASGTIPIQTIASLELNQKNNKDFTQKLFYYLFITGMPVKGDKIKADKIIRHTEIKADGIDIKNLSEGEKKMILIYAITYLLTDDRSIILLDEPDAHIHIERKQDIIDLIDKDDSFTLFTTHSPTILNYIKEENIRLVKNSDDIGVEVFSFDRINTLRAITNGVFSVIDATLAFSTSKDILLVEGTNDYNYIMKAIEKLSPEFDDFGFHIINCGGADNVPVVLEQSLLSMLKDTQLCLCTFDYDDQGRKNYEKIIELAKREKKPNIQAMYHTKLDGSAHVNKEDFYMESYFPVDVFKDKILENVATMMAVIGAKQSFNDLEAYSLQYQKPKSIISKSYENFAADKYVSFKVFLNDTIGKQKQFHAA